MFTIFAEKNEKKPEESLLNRGLDRRNEKMSSRTSANRCNESVAGELAKRESVRRSR